MKLISFLLGALVGVVTVWTYLARREQEMDDVYAVDAQLIGYLN